MFNVKKIMCKKHVFNLRNLYEQARTGTSRSALRVDYPFSLHQYINAT